MQHILFKSSRVALLFTLFFVTAFGHESTHFYSSDVFTFPVFDDNGMEIQAPQQIPGAWAALRTDRRGASQTIHAQGLTPGDVVTSWWVIFNYPEFCTGGVCNEDDVMPFPGNSEAVVSVLYGDGRIVNENGAANFWDRLSVGDDSNAIFGPGLINATTAEIHFVLRTHGPAVAQHLEAQISSYGGGCDHDPSPCADIQFSIFKQTDTSQAEAEETETSIPSATSMPSLGFTLHVDAKQHVESMPELVVHHFCKGISEGIIQCLLFDSHGEPARLIGIESIVSAEIYESFSKKEKAKWHYHKDEIPQVDASFPDLNQEESEALLATLEETYGKVVIVWDPKDGAPIGSPFVSLFHLN